MLSLGTHPDLIPMGYRHKKGAGVQTAAIRRTTVVRPQSWRCSVHTLPTESAPREHLPFYRQLYFQVVFAIIVGVLLGHFEPAYGEAMKPFGDAFIKLIKMIIAPVIFLTIVTGIASMTYLCSLFLLFVKFMADYLT